MAPAKMIYSLLFWSLILIWPARSQETGQAGYYDDSFQGRLTAYEEVYDKNKLTAAHKTHPQGTYLRVTRLDNRKAVVVRVNDKGPYVTGRIVDLSRAAAARLGMLSDGVVAVKVEVVGNDGAPKPKPVIANSPPPTTPITEPTSTLNPSSVPVPAPAKPEPVVPKAKEPEILTPRSVPTPAPQVATVKPSPDKGTLVREGFNQPGLYKVAILRSNSNGYGIQLYALSTYESAMAKVVDLQAKWFSDVLLSIQKNAAGKNEYRVILGPFASEEQARNYQTNLRKKHKLSGFVIKLDAIGN